MKKENNEKQKKDMSKILKKNSTSKTENMKKGLLKVDENRNIIYSFLGGALLVALITVIIWPDRIATLEDGTQPVVTIEGKTFTADFLYEQMKDKFSISLLLDSIDNEILSKKYEENDEMKEEVQQTADEYISYYTQYGYTEETFLEQNGFASKEEFIDYLKIDYRRKLYYEDYLKSQVTDKDIEKYYNDEVFGDINTQHMLVEVNEDMSDEDAKAKAEEIIKKLNDGATWEEVKEEYKDDVTFEDLKYVAFNANYESEFIDALVKLKENSYTKEPVKTTYGYHIIYRLDQKEKASLEDLKDSIIEQLTDKMDEEDPNLYNKTMIKMREDAKIDFKDTVMKEKYEIYCDNLLK